MTEVKLHSNNTCNIPNYVKKSYNMGICSISAQHPLKMSQHYGNFKVFESQYSLHYKVFPQICELLS